MKYNIMNYDNSIAKLNYTVPISKGCRPQIPRKTNPIHQIQMLCIELKGALRNSF